MGLSADIDLFRSDILKYSSKVQNGTEAVLDKAAVRVKKNQQRTLFSSVKKFTGNLSNSIGISSSPLVRVISPDTSIAPYAGWIEDGGRGAFYGYHYIKTSLSGVSRFIEVEIKRLIG